MPRFFNRIRKQLAKENKFFQYSRYAIGEILLVVIGILIALQINTWNKEREDQILKQSYLNSLIEDLAKDIDAIQNTIAYQIEDSLRIAEHQKRLTKKDASLEDMLSLIVYDWDPRIGGLSSFNTNTVEALVNTGNINLIDSEIQNALTNLKRNQEQHISSFIPFVEFYRNSGNGAVSVPTKFGSINKGPIFEEMLNDVDKVAIAHKFNNSLTLKRQAYRISIYTLSGILTETEDLIGLIGAKIDSK